MDIDDPNLTLAEIFRRWPWTVSAFLDNRTKCPICPIASYHTIIDACAEYHLDEDAFRRELRALQQSEQAKTKARR